MVSVGVGKHLWAVKNQQSAIWKRGTGSDRGRLTKKRFKALYQKIGICYFFVIVKGTPASGLAVSTDMRGERAPNTAVSHKIAIAKNWKKQISLRQDQVTLSSVIQSAEHKNWYTLGNWLQVFHEIHTVKTYKKCWLNKAEAVSQRKALPSAQLRAKNMSKVPQVFDLWVHVFPNWPIVRTILQLPTPISKTCALEISKCW